MRFYVDIDDDLMSKAMKLSGFTKKREVIELAINEFIQRRTQKSLLELRGAIQFMDEYDYKALREGQIN